jgi:4-hydroxybenzoate polyprenyltransferase
MLLKNRINISNLVRFYRFFKLIRIQNLLIIWATHYFSAFFLFNNISTKALILDINVHLMGFIAVFSAAAGYIINDYFDIKIDSINKPKKVIIGRFITRRWALFWHYLFVFIALFLSIFISIKLFFIVAFIQFLLWIYALKLKRVPFVGNFVVALLTASVIAILAFYFQYISERILVFIAFAFTSNIIREIVKDIEDIKGDKKENCKTLPIVLGINQTKWIMAFFIVLFLCQLGWLVFIAKTIKIAVLALCFALFLLIYSIKMVKADNKADFHELSTYAKWLMLGGLLLMAV